MKEILCQHRVLSKGTSKTEAVNKRLVGAYARHARQEGTLGELLSASSVSTQGHFTLGPFHPGDHYIHFNSARIRKKKKHETYPGLK